MKWGEVARTAIVGTALGAAIAALLGQFIQWAQQVVASGALTWK